MKLIRTISKYIKDFVAKFILEITAAITVILIVAAFGIGNTENKSVVNNYYKTDNLSTSYNEIEENVLNPDENSSNVNYELSSDSNIYKEDINDDNPSIIAIRRYYNYLDSSQLQKAYDMYIKKPVNFNTYVGWYKNTAIAEPYNFIEQAENLFSFNVNYQEHNQLPTKYRVVMQVSDGKIETIKSNEIILSE